MEAGKIVGIYKVSGQRRVLAVVDVDSPDELDQIIMGQLPIAHNLEIAEVVPVREYAAFAEDVRARWASERQPSRYRNLAGPTRHFLVGPPNRGRRCSSRRLPRPLVP